MGSKARADAPSSVTGGDEPRRWRYGRASPSQAGPGRAVAGGSAEPDWARLMQ